MEVAADKLQRRQSRAEKANKARARTRSEFKALLHEIGVLTARAGGEKIMTCAGRRAIGKDGRSTQLILADTLRCVRKIREGMASRPPDDRAHALPAGEVASSSRAVSMAPHASPQCLLPQSPAIKPVIDDYMIESGLLSSHTVACFLIEMPGWTLKAMSPGARQVLGPSPFGDYEGQELLNGFVHWKDVALLEGMWVSALASGSASYSFIKFLQSNLQTVRHEGAPECANHQTPCKLSGCDGEEEWCLSNLRCAEYTEEHGIYRLLPADAVLEENADSQDAWHHEPPGALHEFSAERSAMPASRACAVPGPGHKDLDSDREGVAREPPWKRSTCERCIFQHRFVSLRTEIVCLYKQVHGQRQVGMLMAPLDTASPWTHTKFGGGGEEAGSWGRSEDDLSACATEGARVREEESWEDGDKDLNARALSGMYRFDWEYDMPNGLTPGDLRQFLNDLGAESRSDPAKAAVPGPVEVAPAASFRTAADLPDRRLMALHPAARNMIALYQTVARVTGALITVANTAAKTVVNTILRYAEVHVMYDEDDDVPAVTVHARVSVMGLSGSWTKLGRVRADGFTVHAPQCGLGVMHSRVKSPPGTLTLMSFWVHDRPYQELSKARREAREEQHSRAGGRGSCSYTGEVGHDGTTPVRVTTEVPSAAVTPLTSSHACTCEREKASAGSMPLPRDEAVTRAYIQHKAARLDQRYVQHTRIAHFDKWTQTLEAHGFLPGRGEYGFRLNKIGPELSIADSVPTAHDGSVEQGQA